jgi:hypothetical protein
MWLLWVYVFHWFPFWDMLCLCYSCYSVLTNFFGGYDPCQKVSPGFSWRRIPQKAPPLFTMRYFFLGLFLWFFMQFVGQLKLLFLKLLTINFFVCLFYLFSFQPTNGGRCKLFYIVSWFISWVLISASIICYFYPFLSVLCICFSFM